MRHHREMIVAAAIRLGNANENRGVVSVERPGRHHDCVKAMADAGLPTPIIGEQGFITSYGRFVGRELAHYIAKSAEQPFIERNGYRGDKLFSEDSW